MSIFVTSLFPLILSGVPAAHAAPAPLAPAAVAKPVVVKAVTAKPVVKPAIAPAPAKAAGPVGGELIHVQAPAPSPAPPAAATAPAPSAALDKAAIIDRASKALEVVKTAQGKFSQTAAGQTSAGNFYISRPGKIRFEYTTPEPSFIVSDGASVSFEEPKRGSYDSVPLASTQLHLFLRSNVDLKRDGSATKAECSNGSCFVTLVDKTGEAEGSMTLEFRQADFELLGWKAVTGTGDITAVRLSGTQTNVKLSPALFVVKDPADNRGNRR